MLRTMPSPNDPQVHMTLWEDPEFVVKGVLVHHNILFLHLQRNFTKLTPSLYKRGLLACAQIKAAAAERGILNLYVLVPEELVKWEQMLGFSKYAILQDNVTNQYVHIMIQPTKDSP